MKKKLLLTALIASLLPSCAAIDGTRPNFPPITVKGKIKGQDISVTVYPDGSKPSEIIFDNPDGLVVDLGK